MTSTLPAPLFGRMTTQSDAPALSVVVPMFNEQGNAGALVREIAGALASIPHEICAVDDASKDGTRAELEAALADLPQLRILAHGKNAGQSRAIRTGVLAARAPVIATLDGDGQNVPGDIPALYEKLTRQGAPALLGMVAGERQGRQDSRAKLMASRYANILRKRLLQDEAEDTGCGLKLFARHAFLRLPYFDHCHRYLPALMRREGFEVEFAPVAHRPRIAGVSKYTNWQRAAVAFRDMVGVTWLLARARQPVTVEEIS
jgi:dolichol-phosphate mannosyltransferase